MAAGETVGGARSGGGETLDRLDLVGDGVMVVGAAVGSSAGLLVSSRLEAKERKAERERRADR
jgi:hypothetical protein